MYLYFLFQIDGSSGNDLYSPEGESSPAPSSVEPQHILPTQGIQTSRTSSFEIENLLKTAELVRMSKEILTVKL